MAKMKKKVKIKRHIPMLLMVLACLWILAGCQSNTVNEAMEQRLSTEWLDEHGITISKQGDFSESIYNESGKTVKLPCNITITEDAVDQESKQVNATITYDLTKIKSAGYWYWHTAFDRYTGQCFNIENLNLDDDDVALCDSTIELDGQSYYISGTSESDESFPIETVTVSVDVPAKYDGLVFQVGYYSDDEQQDEIVEDPEVNFINEKNTFGYNNLYFTFLNQ